MRAARLVLLLACCPLHAAERSAPVNYVLHCSGCHGVDGSGHESAGVPDFRDAVGAFARDEEGRTYLLHVPGIVSASLTDEEIAALLDYVMVRWGGESLRSGFVRFTTAEVAARRRERIDDVVQFRRRIVERLNGEGIRTASYPWP